MANKLQITITAVDRATAVVRRINGSMGQMLRPVNQLGQSLRSFGREMGLNKVGASIAGVGRAASDVGSKVAGLLAPLGVITGGGILAGLTAMTLEWSRMGAEVSRTAQGLDMQVGQLQALRGAAGLAGLGAHDLTGGLKSLGDTLEDALYGRNQQALVVLNRLGVGIHHTADGSIDAARGMRDLSKAIAGIKNVQVQGLIARTFGLEAVLPLLRQGPAAIAAYEAKVAELGGVMSGPAVAAAGRFQLSLNYLNVATQSVRNTIGEKLIPIVQPLVDRFTNWIAANRELIATKVASFVDGLVDSISRLDLQKVTDDVRDFKDDVEKVIDKMGGWENAAIGVAIVMNGNLIASVLNLGMALTGLSMQAIPLTIRSFGLLQGAMAGGLLRAALMAEGLSGLATGIPIVGAAVRGLSTAFLAAGAAIEATPIGWLITGIAAVAVGVYAIYRNWDGIVAYFSKKFSGIKAAFEQGWVNGIGTMLREFNPIHIVRDALNGLSKWLFNYDLYEGGKRVIASLIRGMKGAAGMLPQSVQKFLGIEDWAKVPPTPAAAASAGPAKPGAPAAKAAAAVPSAQAAPQNAATRAVVGPGPSDPATGPAPRGLRNNNPGNLRGWGSGPKDRDGFDIFPTMDDGLSAAARNLILQQQKHGLNTIRGIVGRWAPPRENDTAAYISDVARQTGRGVDEQLNLQDPKTLAPLLSSIIRREGNAGGVSEEMINKAVASQLGAGGAVDAASGSRKLEVELTLHGMPAGVTATARTRTGESMPVRVASTMPTGVTP